MQKSLKVYKNNRNRLSISTVLKQKCLTLSNLKNVCDGHRFTCVWTRECYSKCAAVYSVVYQPYSINQGLVVSKWCISESNLTVPRLELISTHMPANFV